MRRFEHNWMWGWGLLLLVVLVWLLNFAPALHRLPIFGLHAPTCCCQCAAGGCSDIQKPAAPTIAQSSDSDLDSRSACPICRFFEQYHALADCCKDASCVQWRDAPETHLGLCLSAEPLAAKARGPPV